MTESACARIARTSPTPGDDGRVPRRGRGRVVAATGAVVALALCGLGTLPNGEAVASPKDEKTLKPDDVVPVEVRIPGVGSLEGARVNLQFRRQDGGLRRWGGAVEDGSRVRVPRSLLASLAGPESMMLLGDGLPFIQAFKDRGGLRSGPQDGVHLTAIERRWIEGWWTLSVDGGHGVDSWSLVPPDGTVLIAVRCDARDGAFGIPARVIDPRRWTSYRTRGDGTAHLAATRGRDGTFVVLPRDHAAVVVDAGELLSRRAEGDARCVVLDVQSGSTLIGAVTLPKHEAAGPLSWNGWAWDRATGVMIGTGRFDVEGRVHFDHLPPRDIEVVVEARSLGGFTVRGTWSGRPGGAPVEIAMCESDVHLEPRSDLEAGLRTRSLDPSDALECRSAGTSEAWVPIPTYPGGVSNVPGAFEVRRRRRDDGDRPSRTVTARSGVTLILGAFE